MRSRRRCRSSGAHPEDPSCFVDTLSGRKIPSEREPGTRPGGETAVHEGASQWFRRAAARANRSGWTAPTGGLSRRTPNATTRLIPRTARRRPALHAGGPERLGLRREARLPRRVPVHARRPADDVPRPPLDDAPVRRLRRRRGVERALPLPARRRARPASRSRSTCRRRSATTPTTRWPRARSARSASRSPRSRTWRLLMKDIPLEKVTTSMTINATGAILLAFYVAVAKKQGADLAKIGGTIQNDILKEYIARGTYIFPPRRLDAADHGRLRLVQGQPAGLEHDQHQRLPHARGRLHGRRRRSRSPSPTPSPTCEAALDAGPRRSTSSRRACRSSSPRSPTSSRRSRSSAPRAGSGRSIADGALRREGPALADAALPHADRRLDADRAAAGEQHRPHGHPGARRGARRHAVAAHQLDGRGARAADREGGRRSRCARSRSSATRPASPTSSTRWPAPTTSRS